MISVRKTNSLLLIIVLGLSLPGSGQNLISKTAKVRFFSSTPIEDIKASSDNGTVVLVARTGSIAFQVPVKSFEFAKGLMREHFNENYMESDKYPYARFNGKLNQAIDLTKDGDYKISAIGTLIIHGVPKKRNISGKIKVSNGTAQIISAFDVACADHNIKIPTLVITKISEVIKVYVDATLKP